MSSTMDPAKMKVVELRSELTARGLDTKGNKAVLVKRLKDALEEELQKELPNTSIADTSTEDLNASQESTADKTEDEPQGDEEKPVEKMEVEEESASSEKQEEAEEKQPETVQNENQKTEEKKSSENHKTGKEKDTKEATEANATKEKKDKTSEKQTDKNKEPRGSKRPRSPSPNRGQSKRARSPIKEDEPPIDNNKVQLSWYDCDLHLEIDKQSFLSAKPYHEGAFGYAWAGVRATHGISSGKARYEVKITDNLKWEEIIRPLSKKELEKRAQKSGRKKEDQKRDSKRSKTEHENNVKTESKGSRKEESKATDKEKNKATNKEENKKIDKENKTTDKEGSKTTDKEESKSTNKEENKTTDKEENKGTDKEENKTAENGENKTTDNGENKTSDKEEKKATDKEETKEENKTANAEENGKEEMDTSESQSAEQEKMDTSESQVAETSTDKKETDVAKEIKETEKVKNGTDDGKENVENEKKQDKKQQSEKKEEVIEPFPTHLVRVGWSILDTGLQLGETKHSYAYESSGRFIANSEFTDCGIKAGVGDVIGAYIDISEDSVTFSFTINGKVQPLVKTIPRSEFPEENFALFPHVLSQNCRFEVNFGSREEPWFADPEELQGYCFMDKLDTKVSGPIRPEKREECEVIMMCGLPASGKTHWAKEWVQSHPEKRYTLVGNSHLLEKMTIHGKPLKTRYQGKWNIVLDKIVKCMNNLLKTAGLRRRNYIIDQTNVLPTAQRDKMRLFEGFKRRAVVIVVNDEEQAKRQALQEAQGGKDLPDPAVLEMKAMMGLPKVSDWLSEVTYVELNEEESRKMVQKYNKEGRDAGFKAYPDRKDKRYPLNRWDHNSSRRFRGGYNRNYGYNRGGNWSNRRPPSGSWNQDVRNRGPSGGRDWGRQGGRNPPPRDSRSQSSSYNRRDRSGGSSWQGNWQGQGNWNSQGNQNWGGSNWGGQSQDHQWKGGYGQNYSQNYGQSHGNYGNWDYYGGQGYDQGWNSQGSQYSGGYGNSSYGGQYPHNWTQGQRSGKYRK